jgi:hypothetical protein
MRGAPHVGFSTTIRKINSRTSFDVCRLPTGLLTLEISFQYNRNSPLCQRTTVSGVTFLPIYNSYGCPYLEPIGENVSNSKF